MHNMFAMCVIIVMCDDYGVYNVWYMGVTMYGCVCMCAWGCEVCIVYDVLNVCVVCDEHNVWNLHVHMNVEMYVLVCMHVWCV